MANYRLTFIRGQALRAAVALLEWLTEPATVVDAMAPTCANGVHRYATRQTTGRETCVGCYEEEAAIPSALGPVIDTTPTHTTLVLSERGVDLHLCDWRALAETARAAGGVDGVFADTPYSQRTHAGHDSGVDQSNTDAYEGRPSKRTPTLHRNELAYAYWTAADVRDFVGAWQPLTRGWFLSLTDHVLAPAWEEALDAAGMYTFAPIACVDVGSRIRLVGDGPSNWTTWLVAARPKTREFQRWGTLDGAYVVPPGVREQRRTGVTSVVGGKTTWLMRALVKDYSRPGDTLCDPTSGAGTLGVACIAEGRRALLGDRDASHVEIARKRILAAPGYQHRISLDITPTTYAPTSLDFG